MEYKHLRVDFLIGPTTWQSLFYNFKIADRLTLLQFNSNWLLSYLEGLEKEQWPKMSNYSKGSNTRSKSWAI